MAAILKMAVKQSTQQQNMATFSGVTICEESSLLSVLFDELSETNNFQVIQPDKCSWVTRHCSLLFLQFSVDSIKYIF